MPTPKGPHSGDNWYPTPDKEGFFGALIALAGEEKDVTGMAGLSMAKQQTMGSGHGKSLSGSGGQVKITKSRTWKVLLALS